MKNLDLKWHRAKLVVIRNRFGIMYGTFLFLWTFSFVLGMLLLGRINDVVNRIQDNQKAEACILQLARKDRTSKRIAGCVDKNTSHHSKQDFKFNSSNSSPMISSTSIPVSLPVPTPTIKVVKQPTQSVSKVAPKVAAQPKPQPVRKIITRVNALGQTECQVEGFTGWVLEVNGVCP